MRSGDYSLLENFNNENSSYRNDEQIPNSNDTNIKNSE